MGIRKFRFKDLRPGMIMMEWTKKGPGVNGWANVEFLQRKIGNSFEVYFIGIEAKQIPNSEIHKINSKTWNQYYYRYYQAPYEDFRKILKGVFGVF
jgi:hypothetical protein